MHFEIYQDTDDGYWHWRLLDNESEQPLACSPAGGYTSRGVALSAVEAIKAGAAGAWIDA